ncbi:molybdate ABC transporter permease subunit [bacterium]|nr:molybdate ABC transporter permease subunit [bacterium]MCI0619262.1 molybdate ABC transporter permease subunit [bacterium]
MSESQIVWFSAQSAFLAALLILPPGLFIAWLLARYSWKGKSLIETLITLPLVMPPVATGLLLLRLFGKKGWIGSWIYDWFGLNIVFTWRAVVLAMAVMSFPLLVRTARVAFEEVNPRLEQVALSLGAGPFRVFSTITLPLARRGIIAGFILAFARALGEFGATILVAGVIPGRTATLSTSIYQYIQLGQDDMAFRLLLFSIAIAFVAVFASEFYLKRKKHETHN